MRIAALHIRDERPWNPGFQQELDELNRGALATIAALGWQAECVPSAVRPVGESLRAARAADAVVLMGGEDVSPELYGGSASYQDGGRWEPDADAAHIAVVQDCLAAGRPLLTICRGTQILNVALGGTLIQHLENVHEHRGFGHGDTAFVDSVVEIEPELRGDVDPADTVMCSHHQAIAALGEGLVVVARGAGDVIEAVVHESAPITGVQWHPEHPRVAGRQLRALLLRLQRQQG